MIYDFFSFQTLTQAQSALRILRKREIAATIISTPVGMSSVGCGHSLRVSLKDARKAEIHLTRAGIPYKKTADDTPGSDRGW